MAFLPLPLLGLSQRQKPLCICQWPEVKLWAAEMRLDPSGILDIKYVLVIWLEDNGIEGERSRLVFDFECSLIDPDGDFLTKLSPSSPKKRQLKRGS